jgi:hypothetical protein
MFFTYFIWSQNAKFGETLRDLDASSSLPPAYLVENGGQRKKNALPNDQIAGIENTQIINMSSVYFDILTL